jgi:hypothetical protein
VTKTIIAGMMTVIGAEMMMMATETETAADATMAGRGWPEYFAVALDLQTSVAMDTVITGVRRGKTTGQTTGEAGMTVAAGAAVWHLWRCTGLRTMLGSSFSQVAR